MLIIRMYIFFVIVVVVVVVFLGVSLLQSEYNIHQKPVLIIKGPILGVGVIEF